MKKILMSVMFIVYSTTAFADQVCQGVVEGTTINGNVKVSTDCKLVRVKVDGNIILLPNAALKIFNSDIKGNIEASSTFNTIEATNNMINGNVKLEKGKNIRFVGNNINGNFQVEKNQSNIFIQNNRIDGNLKCQENAVPPQGGQNYVKGDKEQQCRAL